MHELELTLTLSDDGRRLIETAASRWPERTRLALTRSRRRLEAFLSRRVLAAAAGAIGTAQKNIATRARLFGAGRWYSKIEDDAVKVWFGTNPIPAHRLGRSKRTARGNLMIGRKSWGAGMWWQKDGPQGRGFYRRTHGEPKRLEVQIDPPARAAVARIGEEALERLEREVRQQLRYALEIE